MYLYIMVGRSFEKNVLQPYINFDFEHNILL